MAEQHDPVRKRDQWSGRGAFVLAAIGSAVGLGNLWGFPYKVYEGGGGAFLIPYLIALVCLGLPLLIGEFSLGHWSQQSPPGAFARVARQYKFIGWWLAALAFIIVTYYTVVLAWCVLLLVDSVQGLFGASLPWGASAEAANSYFQAVSGAGSGLAITGLEWPVVGALAVSWLLIYLSLFKGVKWVSKVVLLTVPLPWLMLLILTVRGLTLPGAMEGLKFYLEPDWAKLADASTWRLAFGQVFFTLSLGFAVMLSYASFLHRRSDLNNNALIIGLGDLATSFIAGLAVFSTLGAMAVATNQPITEVVASGPSLSFVTFPYALAQLPEWQALFAALFFVALLTLGIDSAFSIVEAVLAAVCDNTPWARAIVLPMICVIGFVIGLLFATTNGGINWLSMIDGLVFGPVGILIAALAECYVVAWAFNGRFSRRMRDHANERSDWRLSVLWEWMVKFVAPSLLIVLFVWAFSDAIADALPTLANPGFGWLGLTNWPFLLGVVIFLGLPVALGLLTRGRAAAPEDAPGARILTGIIVGSLVVGLTIGLVRWANQPSTVRLAHGDTLTGHLISTDAGGGLTIDHKHLGEVQLAAGALAHPSRRTESPDKAGESTRSIELASGDTLTVSQVSEIEGGRIRFTHPDLGTRTLTAGVAALPTSKGETDPTTDQASPAELTITAYVVLGLAFLVIFGGLLWCFWRAIQAAGTRDTEIQDEPSI